ncbi:hypothetical protein RRG08_036217 [Elysia crispata]|uniref:Uncharacterized protein n=1 Tax=Elysia crispata TaxID=231223 RepID=A0AAE0XE26_9GAST|nr:hypothetical protein RRG08_036217 [Elysia crispata]
MQNYRELESLIVSISTDAYVDQPQQASVLGSSQLALDHNELRFVTEMRDTKDKRAKFKFPSLCAITILTPHTRSRPPRSAAPGHVQLDQTPNRINPASPCGRLLNRINPTAPSGQQAHLLDILRTIDASRSSGQQFAVNPLKPGAALQSQSACSST